MTNKYFLYTVVDDIVDVDVEKFEMYCWGGKWVSHLIKKASLPEMGVYGCNKIETRTLGRAIISKDPKPKHSHKIEKKFLWNVNRLGQIMYKENLVQIIV
jgi:hypothetical protein